MGSPLLKTAFVIFALLSPAVVLGRQFTRKTEKSQEMDRHNAEFHAWLAALAARYPRYSLQQIRFYAVSRGLFHPSTPSPCDTSVECEAGAMFRTIDGTCNNLDKPLLGAINRPFARFCPAEYADGMGEPFGMNAIFFRASEDEPANGRSLDMDDDFMLDFVADEDLDREIGLETPTDSDVVAAEDEEESRTSSSSSSWWFWQKWFECSSGERINLPEPRLVSTTFHPDEDMPDPDITLMVMQFGQFLDHDLTRTPEAEAVDENDQAVDCCEDPTASPECIPIPIPMGDSFIEENMADCLELTRSTAFCEDETNKREQMNVVTAFVDASNVYGSDQETVDRLRGDAPNGELLAEVLNEGTANELEVLPLLRNEPVDGVLTDVFEAGDTRVLENPGLSTVHTLFLREHNRLAREIAAEDPSLSSDEIFENARRIVGAEMQAIVYGEFLPVVLGERTVRYKGLSVSSFMTRYISRIDPTIRNEFATAAFRFGHTLIQGTVEERDPADNSLDGSHELVGNFFDPEVVFAGAFEGEGNDRILAGLTRQCAQSFDRFVDEAVTNFLEPEFSQPLTDLMSRNIQRGRDHGMPGYNDFRKKCGLSRACSWSRPPAEISAEDWETLSTLYNHPNDIDVFVGGLAERSFDGGVVGRTFNCIIAAQFQRLKYGDRFFFSHRDQVASLTQDQFDNVRVRTLGDVLCDNTDITTVTENVFRKNAADMSCAGANQINVSLFV